jgi:hypothetical protein
VSDARSCAARAALCTAKPSTTRPVATNLLVVVNVLLPQRVNILTRNSCVAGGKVVGDRPNLFLPPRNFLQTLPYKNL